MKACYVCHRLLLRRDFPTLIALLDIGANFLDTLCHRGTIEGNETHRQAVTKTVDLLVVGNSSATRVWVSVMWNASFWDKTPSSDTTGGI